MSYSSYYPEVDKTLYDLSSASRKALIENKRALLVMCEEIDETDEMDETDELDETDEIVDECKKCNDGYHKYYYCKAEFCKFCDKFHLPDNQHFCKNYHGREW